MKSSFTLNAKNCWVVLPTYCEADNLPIIINRLRSLNLGLNIVVVDDNSPDGTAAVADSIAEIEPGVHVFRRNGTKGLGRAYMDGFRYALDAGADIVITMDVDLSHQPAELPPLIDAMCFADMAIGSRYIQGGRIKNWPKRRHFLSGSANRFVRTLFRMNINDCTSGYRAYRRSVIEMILDRKPNSSGYSFLVEVLYLATHWSTHITEVPICYVERKLGNSKMGWRQIVYGALILVSLRCKMFFSGDVATISAGRRSHALAAADLGDG